MRDLQTFSAGKSIVHSEQTTHVCHETQYSTHELMSSASWQTSIAIVQKTLIFNCAGNINVQIDMQLALKQVVTSRD